jgi:tyrosine-protein phosphatase YwqE
MFGFRRGRKAARSGKPTPDLAWDLHSHLVPGVDDGVPTIDDALAAIRELHSLGYRGSVVTPHVYRGLYPNTRETLEPALSSLRTALANAGIDYAIQMAAEYFADEHLIELAGREPLLSFGSPDAPLVLVEYPYSVEPLLWADALTALLRNGYTPVLAHIERYRFVSDNPDLWLERFAQFGVKIQCNIGSLVGQYGQRAFELARRMRDQRLATFWGTDLHRPAQIEKFIRPGLTHLTELGQLNAELAPH